jgi:hypothetical protein
MPGTQACPGPSAENGTASLLRLFTQHMTLHAQKCTSAVNKRSRVAGGKRLFRFVQRQLPF